MLKSPLSVNDLRARIELEFQELIWTNFIRNSARIMEKRCLICTEKGGRHVQHN